MKRLFQFCIQFHIKQHSYVSMVTRGISNFYPDDDDTSYAQWGKKRKEIIEKRLRTNRFVPIQSREERGLYNMELFKQIAAGKYMTDYRGLEIMKGPIDMTVLRQLLWRIKPRTIIELGTYNGTCALWLSDIMRLMSRACRIYTMDIDTSMVLPEVRQLAGDSVTFIEGDANQIDRIFPPDLLRATLRPLLVLEDCHSNLEGVIRHFNRHMQTGDYFVIEDTNPNNSKYFYLGEEYSRKYEAIGPEKLNCLKKVLSGMGDTFSVDTYFTDMFGYNSTNNWDGYLRKMKDN